MCVCELHTDMHTPYSELMEVFTAKTVLDKLSVTLGYPFLCMGEGAENDGDMNRHYNKSWILTI